MPVRGLHHVDRIANARGPVPARPRNGRDQSQFPVEHRNAENQRVDPEFRATVEYKLVKVGSNNEISGAPFSTQQNGNEIDTVSQIMDRIASQVVDQVKKGAPRCRSSRDSDRLTVSAVAARSSLFFCDKISQ